MRFKPQALALAINVRHAVKVQGHLWKIITDEGQEGEELTTIKVEQSCILAVVSPFAMTHPARCGNIHKGQLIRVQFGDHYCANVQS